MALAESFPGKEAIGDLVSATSYVREAVVALDEGFAPPRSGRRREWCVGDEVALKREYLALYPELEGAARIRVADVHRTKNGRGAQVTLKLEVHHETQPDGAVPANIVAPSAHFETKSHVAH